MRNLSMKKFGTPTGTAPGSASDVVGLDSVGTPCALRSAFRGARSRCRPRSGETVRRELGARFEVALHRSAEAFAPSAPPLA